MHTAKYLNTVTMTLKQKHDKNRKLKTGAMLLLISDKAARLCVPETWNQEDILKYATTIYPGVWKLRDSYDPIMRDLREVPCPESKHHRHVALVATDPSFDKLFEEIL